jgi:hypothetical protein
LLDIGAIRAQVNGLAAGGIRLDSSEVKSLLATLQQPVNWHQFMSSILSKPDELARVAARSYHHANGFDKIILLDQSPHLILRAHIWWPTHKSREPENSDIHNHFWDFSSVVLHGKLDIEYFVRAESGLETTQYRYCPDPSGEGRYAMNLIGPCRLRRILVGSIQAGDLYTLSHDVLHRVTEQPMRPCATLVLQGPVITKTNDVHSLSPLADERAHVGISYFDSTALAPRLERLAQLMLRGDQS